jgi:hypothetical protein
MNTGDMEFNSHQYKPFSVLYTALDRLGGLPDAFSMGTGALSPQVK